MGHGGLHGPMHFLRTAPRRGVGGEPQGVVGQDVQSCPSMLWAAARAMPIDDFTPRRKDRLRGAESEGVMRCPLSRRRRSRVRVIETLATAMCTTARSGPPVNATARS